MNLFQRGDFSLHSGQTSDYKIDCDALTDKDWETLAYLISRRCNFREVVGIPQGGIKLELALRKYVTEGPVLIVDDVLTTGQSFYEASEGFDGDCIGYVVFARGKCPPWISALFQMEVIDGTQDTGGDSRQSA